MAARKIVPSKPSECVAALSLKEDGETTPYLSIFYTMLDGALHFFAYPVHGVSDTVKPGETWLTYNDQGEINPDRIVPLLKGRVNTDGSGAIDDAEFRSESDALNFVAALRAVYQMVRELQAQEA